MRIHQLLAAIAIFAVPLVVAAQAAKKLPRLGLAAAGAADCKPNPLHELFYGRLRDLGYAVGKSIAVEFKCYRNGDEMRKVLGAFVMQKVDAIVVFAPLPALAARDLTREIPVVCGSCGDPLDNGLVASLSRPGGNITGLASLSAELIGKRLNLLKETMPGIVRVAALTNPDNPGTRTTLRALDAAGGNLNLEITRIEFRSIDDFERAFRAAAAANAGAVLIQDDPFVFPRRKQIGELSLKLKLPVFAGINELADDGVLMTYGPNREDMYRRSAGYVDRILKGAKAGELPFEQASKFDLIVNLRTAGALGIKFPQSVLLQATRVIE